MCNDRGMSRRISRLSLAVSICLLAVPAGAQARSVTVKYSSCAGLLKKYPAGIAVSKAKKGKTKAFVSASLYNQNKALDADGDGIACDAGDLDTASWGPFSLKGDGPGTADLKIPAGKPAILTLTHDGEENFVVTTLDKDDEQIDQLVSAVGEYKGTVFVGTGEEDAPVVPKSLNVEADGKWTAKVASATTAPAFSTSKSGTGDFVLRYKGGATSVNVTHDGEDMFAITIFTSKGVYVDLVVSEEGAVDTSFELPADCYIAITGDGNWKLSK